MKNKVVIAVVLLLCVGVVFCTACTMEGVPQVVMPQTEKTEAQTESTLTVNATETVKVAPDVAYVYIGVRTEADSADIAQTENAKVANAFVDAVKKQGVAEEDISTSNINIYQDYDNPQKFVMENTYQIMIRDINKTGAVIDAAIAAGANSTYSLSFGVVDQDAVYVEALSKAMQSIDAKVAAVASAGGYEIVRPLSIQENGTSSFRNVPMPEMAVMDTGSAVTPISPGEIEVSASVTGTYVIK